MSFPECPSAFDSQTPDGRVVHRVCLDEAKPTCRMAVTARACRLCQAPEAGNDEASQAVDAAPPPEPPNLGRRALSYAEALVQWTAAGRPERSDKDVEQIFNRCCKPCRWYDHRRQICRGCGCRVAQNGIAVLNKIKMATEHCPRNLW